MWIVQVSGSPRQAQREPLIPLGRIESLRELRAHAGSADRVQASRLPRAPALFLRDRLYRRCAWLGSRSLARKSTLPPLLADPLAAPRASPRQHDVRA